MSASESEDLDMYLISNCCDSDSQDSDSETSHPSCDDQEDDLVVKNDAKKCTCMQASYVS